MGGVQRAMAFQYMPVSKAIKAWFAALIVCAFSTMHRGNCHGKDQRKSDQEK